MIGEYPTPALQEPESDSSYYGLRAPILGLQPRDGDSEQQRPTAPLTFFQTLFLALLMWITGETDEVAGASVEKAEDKSVPLPAVSSQQGEPYVLGPYTKPAPVPHATKIVSPRRLTWPRNLAFGEVMRKKNLEDAERRRRKEEKDTLQKGWIVEDDENNLLFSPLVEALSAFTFDDQPVQEERIKQGAALPTAYCDGAGAVPGPCLLKPSPPFVAKPIMTMATAGEDSDDDFEAIVSELVLSIESNEPVQGEMDPPLPVFAKPGPSVASTTASVAAPAAVPIPMDSKPTITVTMPAGRAIAPMRTKKPSVMPVVVMPTAAADAADAAAAAAAVTVPMDSMATVTVTMPAGRAIAPMRKKKPSVTPVVVIAKPGPSVAASAAAAAAAAAVTVPMDSMPTGTVTMPAGRAIAPMRKKKPSVTPVVVMPTDRPIAKPRARARGLNNGRSV